MEQDRLEIVRSLQASKPMRPSKKGQRTISSPSVFAADEDDISTSKQISVPVLDLDDDTLSPYGPLSASSDGNKIKASRTLKSELDIESALPFTGIAETSPIEHKSPVTLTHPRSYSDASTRPVNLVPRPQGDRIKGDRAPGFLFADHEPTSPNGMKPSAKRNSSVSRRINASSMAEAMRGSLEGYLSDGGKRGRHSIAGSKLSGYSSSKSPSGLARSNHRSRSPGPSILKRYQALSLEDGTPLEPPARLLKPSNMDGTTSIVRSGRKRANSGDTASPHSTSMDKDYFSSIDSEAAVESSDEEGSSDEERIRGRRKNSKDMVGDKIPQTLAETTVEGEGEQAADDAGLDITVTSPGGDRVRNSKPGVHPMNAFDQEGSGDVPVDSDTEADISDIKRAQKLAVIMTPVVSTPKTNRCVRTIYRGDFGKMQREAEENQRRARKYLVATDLSEEAAHALEWTIGTVIRDGDTLLCIYCVDEELGIGEATEGEAGISAQAESLAAIANTPQVIKLPSAQALGPSPLREGVTSRASSPAPTSANRTGFRAEAERFKAVEDITLRVSRLLRKTKLQVRVVIEVIHCKSPRHLITEVIDYLNPTLVVLGSRGRSALKG